MSVRPKHIQLTAVYLAIAGITALHYLTGPHAPQLHDIYRRLYYLPIIVAAFLHGFPGGLMAATIVCVAYAPHAAGHISHDPASSTQKALEMILYLAVGTLTGTLVSRLKRAQRSIEKTARHLEKSLAQLRNAEEELVRAARLAAVGRLSAGLAHEIRNPLASIKGSAEILADDYPPDHPKHRLLRALISESARLNDVLTRFLSFARPRPLNKELFPMVPEIAAVVEFVERRGEERGARIRVDPPPGPSPVVRGDREQLRQVLLNVLLNACQAAGQGGTVEVTGRSTDGHLRLTVHDSGPGFTAEALENAFTPFFTTKEMGTGLGLAISHRIVEYHGGRIRVSNHDAGGGVVEIEIPLGKTDGQDHTDR